MTITLNDVSSLLHLLIVGQFYMYVTLDFTSESLLLVELLGVDFGDIATKLRLWWSHPNEVVVLGVQGVHHTPHMGVCNSNLFLASCWVHTFWLIMVRQRIMCITCYYLSTLRCVVGTYGEMSHSPTCMTNRDTCFARTKQLGGHVTLL